MGFTKRFCSYKQTGKQIQAVIVFCSVSTFVFVTIVHLKNVRNLVEKRMQDYEENFHIQLSKATENGKKLHDGTNDFKPTLGFFTLRNYTQVKHKYPGDAQICFPTTTKVCVIRVPKEVFYTYNGLIASIERHRVSH